MPRRAAALLIALSCVSGPAYGATVNESYMSNCAVCHLPGIAGAPKVGDKADWSRRIRAGKSMLYRNAVEGIPNTAMMAKGGHTDLSDGEVRSIVDYMVAAAAIDRDVLQAAARYEKRGITDREFIALDVDFDGFLSRKELAGDPLLLQNFARFDSDRDGRLDVAEYLKGDATLEHETAAFDVADEALVAAVRAGLAKIPGIDLPNTKVEAERGTVAIVGIVEHADVARQAYGSVKRIKGVKKIDKRLVSGHQMGWD